MLCEKKVNWYCSTYDNTMVSFGVCFVKLHSTEVLYIDYKLIL